MTVNRMILREMLCKALDKEGMALGDILEYAYHKLNLSSRQISDLTWGSRGREACSHTILQYLKMFGIKIKSRGGANFKKKPTLPKFNLDEWLTTPSARLQTKYGMSKNGVYRMAKAAGYPSKKGGWKT